MSDSPCCYQSCGKRRRIDDEIVIPEVVTTNEGPSLTVLPSLEASSSKTDSTFVHGRLPLARSLKEFIEADGHLKYSPRPEWYHDRKRLNFKTTKSCNVASLGADCPLSCEIRRAPLRLNTDESILESESSFLPKLFESSPSMDADTTEDRNSTKVAVFGKDMDHALHVAIREHATQGALILLDHGAPIDAENAKCMTPLIFAAQKGNVILVRELLERGANIYASTLTGLTAILQAAHFGETNVLKLLLQSGSTQLVECANYNQTTPLMRASQEGHVQAVKLLLKAGAQVNRRNRSHLTALMLASQRGHAEIVSILIKHGAEIDATTDDHSTALLLACRRDKIDVARVLVTAGCELSVKDSRGRTAQELAVRKNQKELFDILDPAVQVGLMRKRARHLRNFEVIRTWRLLQQERAVIPVVGEEVQSPLGIHDVNAYLGNALPQYPYLVRSTQFLLRTMTLPEPLVCTITQFLPLPLLWESRIKILTNRTSVNSDDAVRQCFDLIDEILDEGGFPEACDEACVALPVGLKFSSWTAWKDWGRQKGVVEASDTLGSVQSTDLTTSHCPPPRDGNRPTFAEWRRCAGFLRRLEGEQSRLGLVLTSTPYKLPSALINKLVNISDAASLVRRMRSGVHFDVHVAFDLVVLACQLYSWYWIERDERL